MVMHWREWRAVVITDKLQALGSFAIQLDQLPSDVFTKAEPFGTVLVIPARVDNPTARTRGELEAMARYAGVLREKEVDADDPASVLLRGVHLNAWLGDEDGKGAVDTSLLTNYTGTLDFATTVSSVLFVYAFFYNMPLLGGTFTNPPSGGNYTGTHHYETLRQVLDYMTGVYGDAFWRVNPDRTIDAGPDTALFVTDPTAMIVRRSSLAGGDLGLAAARGNLRATEDVADYSTSVTVLGQADGGTIATGTATIVGSSPYTQPDGDAVTITRLVTEAETSVGNANARAQLQLNRFSSSRRTVTLSANTHDFAGEISPGDQVYVYDPDSGLIDTLTQLNYRGQLITPTSVQVVGITYPVTEGYTVVYVHGDGTLTDLTPFVRWEADRDAEVIVGDFARTLTDPSPSPQGRVSDATNPGQDTLSPAAVTLDATPWSTGVQQSDEGTATAYIVPVWLQPLNTDGSVITDGSHYEVQHRRSGASEWRSTVVGWGTVTVETGELTPGATYEHRVRAVDVSGNLGAWSATEATVAEGDTVPPSTPAAPTTVAGDPLSIQVTHDLQKATTGDLELDVASLQVHVGTSAGFTADDTNRVGEIPVGAGLITLGISVVGSFPTFTDATRYVKVIAVDRAGNASAASASTAVNAQLIQTANIGTATITNLLVADVSAAKLTAGTITAAAIIIGASGSIESDNFVTGGAGAGWRLTDTLAELNDVTIRGVLDGVTGTFAGSLSAATGTFAGSLSSATGTFTGTVSAGAFTGGVIDIGGADSTSFHVSSTGAMWLGNAVFASAPFRVSSGGALTATSATITGAITSGSTITGTTITGSTLTSASSGVHVRITSTAAEWYSATSTLRMRISQSGSTCNIGKVSNALTIALSADTITGVSNIGNTEWNSSSSFTADLLNGGTVRVRASSSGAVLQRQGTTSATGFADVGFGVVGTQSSRRAIKNRIRAVPTDESLQRILQLGTAQSFVFKRQAIGDGTNPLVEMHEHLGLIAEEAAAVDRRYAIYDWVDPDDPMKLAPIDHAVPFVVQEEWTDKQAKAAAKVHAAIVYAAALEKFPLEKAVPTNWDERAIVADLIGSTAALHAELDELRSRLDHLTATAA